MGLKLITISENDSGQRLDKFLLKCFGDLPKSKLYSAVRKKDIKLNGKRCAGNEILSVNDTIRVFLPDDILLSSLKNTPYLSDKPLDVVYEDENIIIVYKPAGTDVHSGAENSNDNMVSRLLYYLGFDKSSEQSFTPAFCNRLDRNTSGLLIGAKNAASLREINSCIRDNKIHKKYLAVLYGIPDRKSDTLKLWHCLYKKNTVMISDKKEWGYRETLTEYRIIKEKNDLSLADIKLITGRKHQIRAAFAHIGTPVLGDNKYGSKNINKKYNLDQQMLTAYKIKFLPDRDMKISYLYGMEIITDSIRLKKFYDLF